MLGASMVRGVGCVGATGGHLPFTWVGLVQFLEGSEKAILSRNILAETQERWGVSPGTAGCAAFSGVSLVCLWEA